MNRGYLLLIGSVVIAALTLECGGRTSSGENAANGNDAGSLADGRAGNVVDGQAEDGGPCVSSMGFAVCGGPNSCYLDGGGTCQHCTLEDMKDFAPDAYTLGICWNTAYPGPHAGVCFDDCVYVEDFVVNVWDPIAFEVGPLFSENDAGSRVRYADFSFWTNVGLPAIQSCNGPSGVATCGGSCSPCSSGRSCTGRSPLHPLGLCVPTSPSSTCAHNQACQAGDGCFVFSVQADAQALADEIGWCLPLDECKTTAENLPGGGVCHETTW